MRRALVAVLVAAFLSWTAPAIAQEGSAAEPVATVPVGDEPTAAPAAADSATQLDEVVVTAQRRSESLQDTPISIEAFNPDKLEQRGINGLQDLSAQVPSLTVEPFPTHNATLRLFIRGVGINDAQLTQDPAVGVYMDGVYIARSVGLALDIADLERIEVLRGPQGTLYGRNTTGGAVNLITRRPSTGAFNMTHAVTLADRGGLMAKSSINVPIGEALALKVGALRNQRDGWVENTGPGGDFGNREETAFRFDARWVPWYWLTADYAYERADMDYYNHYFQSTRRPVTSKGQAEPIKSYGESQTVHSEQRLDALASSVPFELSGTRIRGHALTLTVPLLDVYELKYVGSRRSLLDRQYADLGGGLGSQTYRLDSHEYDGPAADAANGGPTPLVIPTVTQQQWSHELQLGGTVLDEQLQFVGGVFWFSEDGVEDRHRLNHQLSSVIPPDQLDELSAAFPLEFDTVLDELGIVDFNQIENLRLVSFVDLNWEIENRARALFGQATWTPDFIESRLHLTVGYRKSQDERRAVKFRLAPTYVEVRTGGQDQARLLQSGEPFPNVEAKREFSDDSWTFIAAYDVTDGISTYLKSSEAYKSGGFNVRDPNVSGATSPQYGFGFSEGFDPERVHTWEAGVKGEWLGRRLRTNLAVFDADYEDMQINFLIPGTVSDTKTANAGKARMRGLELDTTFLLVPGFTLAADYAFLDADVLDVRDVNGNNVSHLFPFTSAPRHSMVVSADWTFWRTRFGDLRGTVGYHYVDKRQGQVITEERRDLTSIPAHDLWNARLTLAGFKWGERSAFDLALWGKNLADKDYVIIAIDNVPQSDRAVVWGEPRSIGFDLVYRYF